MQPSGDGYFRLCSSKSSFRGTDRYRKRFESIDKEYTYYLTLKKYGLYPGTRIREPEKLIPDLDPGVKKNWIPDPDPKPVTLDWDPDPALLFSDFQDANKK
jgi:hypothetical protein